MDGRAYEGDLALAGGGSMISQRRKRCKKTEVEGGMLHAVEGSRCRH